MTLTRALSLSLALLLAVTSQQMAMARGLMNDSSGQVVLCTGQGSITVTFNALGEPIEDTGTLAHICPDCVISVMALPGAPANPQAAFAHSQTLAQTIVPELQSPVIPTRAMARDPPLFA